MWLHFGNQYAGELVFVFLLFVGGLWLPYYFRASSKTLPMYISIYGPYGKGHSKPKMIDASMITLGPDEFFPSGPPSVWATQHSEVEPGVGPHIDKRVKVVYRQTRAHAEVLSLSPLTLSLSLFLNVCSPRVSTVRTKESSLRTFGTGCAPTLPPQSPAPPAE